MLSAFGLVRGPTFGTVTSVIGNRLRRRSMAARVSSSSASMATITSSFSVG